MGDDLLLKLEQAFRKCSDCALHPDYNSLLDQLYDIELTQELVDYLCEKTASKKHIWEIHFAHLRILLLNPSAKTFDLKSYYLERVKRSRRLAIKIFYIRGLSMYTSEEELNPIMEKFCNSMEKMCGYIDYNYILSAPGLPYLVNTYGYPCFVQTLEKAQQEKKRNSALLGGFFTLDERLKQVNLLSPEECQRRMQTFLEKHRNAE